jgi:ubiquinone/menaquinone biosynthesis C-methylase UbiE
MKELKFKDSENKQKSYYNSIANEYDEHYASDNALKYRHNIYAKFLQDFDLKEKMILDAMCGGGQSTEFFLKKGAILTGIDISEKQCENYKKRFPNCEIYCRSILENNLAAETFDFIITDSVHHIHPYVDKCMAEFYRLLKPNCFLMLWEPSAKSISDYFRKIWYKKDKKYFQDNEAAIDLDKLTRDNFYMFKLVKKKFGGNFAYVFIFLTMAMRMKNKKNRFLLTALFFLEKTINYFQNRYTALWFLVLYQKRSK